MSKFIIVRFIFKLILCFFLFISVFNAFSQEFATRLYTSQKDGLIQAQVFSITQSGDGCLWIGTLGGISCFDGIKFTNFTEEEGLLTNAVFDMQWWNDTLFIVTKEGINIMVDGKISTFFYDKKIKFKDGIIKINRQYRFVASHNYDYRFIFDLRTKKIKQFPAEFELANVGAVGHLTDSSVIFENNNGLYELPFYNIFSKRWNPVLLHKLTENSLAVNIIASNRFIDYRSAVEKKFIVKNTGIKPIKNRKNNNHFIETVYFKVPNKELSYYAFITNKGKVFLFSSLGNVYLQENGISTKFSENYNNINKAFEDRNGNIWVATEKGLLKIFIDKFKYYNSKQGYPDNVWSAGRLNDSLLLMASYNNGIHIFYNNGQEKKIKKHFGNKISQCYFGLSKGFNNDYFVSIYPGVASYNVVTNYLKVIDNNMKETASLTLFKDSVNKRILVANIRKLVAVNKDYSTDSLFNIKAIGSFQMIISLAILKDNIFLGLTKGLITYNTKTKKATISHKKIRFNSLVVDHKQTIWAATGRGIMHITADTSYFINGIEKPKEVSSVIVDNHNRLFASGRTKLFVIDLNKFYSDKKNFITYYGLYDGYLGDGPQQDAFFKDYKGDLWLPTEYNVIHVYPDEISSREPQLIVNINSFSNSDGDSITIITDFSKKIKIRYDFNNLKFEFKSVNLVNPERTEYLYTLKNHKRKWSSVTKLRAVEFNNLPPGNYFFEVQASTNNNFSNPPKTTISFVISTPFWQKTWFLIVLVLISAGIIALIILEIKRREKKKSKIKIELANLKNIALSKQIDHHFLANCTSKIVVLYESGKLDEANKYTQTFSGFLRTNLMFLRSEKISLKDELHLIEQYVELERVYGKSFDFVINIASNINTEKIMIFPFMIQPIVENAIKHGVKKISSGNGKIVLSVNVVNKFVLIKVKDNGPGINKSKKDKKESVSLMIIKERLTLTGKDSELTINSNNVGTTFLLKIQNL